MQSGAESVLSLIKKASYLADKGQVTFSCNLKHFPMVRFWKWGRLGISESVGAERRSEEQQLE